LRTIGVALIAGTVVYLLFHARSVLLLKRFYVLSIILIIPITAMVLHTNTIKIDLTNPLWQLAEFIPSKLESKRYAHDDPTSKINGASDIIHRGIKNLTYYGGVSCSILTGIDLDTSRDNLKKYQK